MTDKKTEALKLALEALELGDDASLAERDHAITAIREALSEQPAQQRHISYVCPQCHWSLDEQPAQKQEPVAWRYKKEGGGWFVSDNEPQYVEQWNDIEEIQPLYTSPPAIKPWVGLTDEEKLCANQMWRVMDADGYIRAIEAKLKEKNT